MLASGEAGSEAWRGGGEVWPPAMRVVAATAAYWRWRRLQVGERRNETARSSAFMVKIIYLRRLRDSHRTLAYFRRLSEKPSEISHTSDGLSDSRRKLVICPMAVGTRQI